MTAICDQLCYNRNDWDRPLNSGHRTQQLIRFHQQFNSIQGSLKNRLQISKRIWKALPELTIELYTFFKQLFWRFELNEENALLGHSIEKYFVFQASKAFVRSRKENKDAKRSTSGNLETHAWKKIKTSRIPSKTNAIQFVTFARFMKRMAKNFLYVSLNAICHFRNSVHISRLQCVKYGAKLWNFKRSPI